MQRWRYEKYTELPCVQMAERADGGETMKAWNVSYEAIIIARTRKEAEEIDSYKISGGRP